jgi:hypothetical protein
MPLTPLPRTSLDSWQVRGIMNGTTNYMLCKMEDEGAGYAGTRHAPTASPLTHNACVPHSGRFCLHVVGMAWWVQTL